MSIKTLNRLMGTLNRKAADHVQQYTVISTVIVDGWAVTCGVLGLGGLRHCTVPSSLYQM